MPNVPTIGLIVPPAAGLVPEEGPRMYGGSVKFIAAGLGLGWMTPEGYESVIDRITVLARDLCSRGVSALSIMGTSLTFFKGAAFNQELIDSVHRATGLPTSSMSAGVVEGLRAVGAKRVAVGTAYIDEVNNRLRGFLTESGFEVLALEGLHLDRIGVAKDVSQDKLQELGERVFRASPGADAILISCGGFRTLDLAVPLEAATGVPVVASTPAAFRSAVRLVGHSGAVPGFGRLFSEKTAA
ncbi:MAG: arylmalonate decarboxylase [Betaproteobacteria bacterium]|nr:arylmalonate decarboxylase [Betaproteobacteria bacterium]